MIGRRHHPEADDYSRLKVWPAVQELTSRLKVCLKCLSVVTGCCALLDVAEIMRLELPSENWTNCLKDAQASPDLFQSLLSPLPFFAGAG